MASLIPGGHPGEIENYQKLANKKEIEENRITFHNKIAEYIQNLCILKNMKYLIIDDSYNQKQIESNIVKHFCLS